MFSDPPDSIHDLYDTMKEDPEAAKSIVSSTDTQEAGWLARHIRNKAPQEREEARMEIERELEVRFSCKSKFSDWSLAHRRSALHER